MAKKEEARKCIFDLGDPHNCPYAFLKEETAEMETQTSTTDKNGVTTIIIPLNHEETWPFCYCTHEAAEKHKDEALGWVEPYAPSVFAPTWCPLNQKKGWIARLFGLFN